MYYYKNNLLHYHTMQLGSPLTQECQTDSKKMEI